MTTVTILNQLHRKKFYRLLSLVCSFFYFIKGKGLVKVKFHKDFRAYECRVNGVSYISLGPGWAYSFTYLNQLLIDTYCHYYIPKFGDCVIDVGAGLGEESVVLAQHIGPTGKLFSVEANPITFKGLEYACIHNKFHWIKPLNVALFHQDIIVNIEDDPESYIGNTIQTYGAKNVFQVRGVTLDTLVKENNITRIDFLKLNIEGAEKFLLEGSEMSIEIVRNACISCHDFRHVHHAHGEFYMTKEKIRAYFLSKGFEIQTRNTGNIVIDDFIYAKKSLAS